MRTPGMLNWTETDRQLLLRLNQTNRDISIEQLTTLFNAEAECKARTSTAILQTIYRLRGKQQDLLELGQQSYCAWSVRG